jgi:hypothetical protein
LYRDNVHPSDRKDLDAGGKLVADALLESWREAKPGQAFSTPGWQERKAKNLIGNAEFTDWKADAPAGWRAGGAVTVEKSTGAMPGGSLAVAIRPNGDRDAYLYKVLDDAESAAVRGKTITIAALVRASSAQPRAFALFVCPVEGVTRSFAFGDLNGGKGNWVWLVCSGIPVDAAAAKGSLYLRFYPAFSAKAPQDNEPLLIERVLITEGKRPAGMEEPVSTPAH